MHRRSFITGLISLVAAPAVVRAASLMPVRGIVMRSAEQIVNDALYGTSPMMQMLPMIREWQASVQYQLADMVAYKGLIYQCVEPRSEHAFNSFALHAR